MPGIGSLYLPGSPPMRRSLPSGARWTPASLSGLIGWYDAALSPLFQNSNGTTAATADADPVGYWGDLSGSGNHAKQATAGARPTLKTALQNGRNVLRWDGVDDVLATPALTAAQPNTVYIVLQQRAWASEGRVLAAANTLEIDQRSASPRLALYANGGAVAPISAVGTPALNTWLLFTGLYDGNASSVLELNNAGDTTGANTGTAGPSAQAVGIGAQASGIALFATIDVGTLLIYNARHSAAQRLQVKTYLNALWAVY